MQNRITGSHQIPNDYELSGEELREIIAELEKTGAKTIKFNIGYNTTSGLYHTNLDGLDKKANNDERR